MISSLQIAFDLLNLQWCVLGPGVFQQRSYISLQIRRQIRERRQYVYAKSLEAQERQTYDRKQQLKESLASGKALPTELKKNAKSLGKDLAFDEAQDGAFTFR